MSEDQVGARLRQLTERHKAKLREIEPLWQRRHELSDQLLEVRSQEDFDRIYPEIRQVQAEFAAQWDYIVHLEAEIDALAQQEAKAFLWGRLRKWFGFLWSAKK